MTSLLTLSIGPVQEFISAARRSRDLWAGSRLLSELCRAAAQQLRQDGADLIFPVAEALETPESNISNVLLASLNPGLDARTVALNAEQAARERLSQLTRELQDDLNRHLGEDTARKVMTGHARAQLADLVEITWATVPVTGSYAAARKTVQARLAARKRTRTFGPVTWGSAVQKSSLDGQREVVTQSLRSDQMGRLGLRDGEQLCAPGLLKRVLTFGGDRPEFLSTAHVAAQPYLQALERMDHANVRRAYGRYLDELDRLGVPLQVTRLDRLDPQLLYPSRLAELLPPETATPGTEQALAQACESFLREVGAGQPSPYYAVLHGDGDNMGVVLSALTEQEQHRGLSRDLQDFSSSCRTLVEQHLGLLIYAGGDDVLALVPATNAVACAAALADAFADRLKAYRTENAANGRQTSFSPTLTSGVVIAHMLDPFQDVLDSARRAEKTAKTQGRQSQAGQLGLELSKRSGAPSLLALSNGYVRTHVLALSALYAERRLPGTLAYDLRHLLNDLSDTRTPGLLEREVRRVLRHKGDDGQAILAADQETVLDAFRAFDAQSGTGQFRLQEFGALLVTLSSIQGMQPHAPSREVRP